MKTLIVGGVAGGASAAARLRRLDESAEIILFEKGPYISFANCGLPYYLSRTIPSEDDLLLQTPASFFGRFCVDVRTMQEVISIDRARKCVTVRKIDSGECYEETYDKLILSPGAVAVRPRSIEGVDTEGVFTLRNVPDVMAIDRWLSERRPRHAVVAGGGYVGVELAENLIKRGIAVTMVEFADHIINSADAEMAFLAQQEMRRNGVELRLGCAITAVKKHGGGLIVSTSGGDIETGALLLSIGVAPNSGLAAEAGLSTGVKGCVCVNDRMQTSDPDIYAVGDVTEATHFITGQKCFLGLAGPANRQGRIAADQIAGIDSRYKKTQGTSIMKVFDLAVAGTGLTETAAKAAGIDYDKIYLHSGAHAAYYPDAKPLTVKILFERQNGRLLGGQFVGAEGADKRCDVLATAIRAGLNGTDLIDLELSYTPAYSSAKDPLNMAGFMIENILTGKVKNFHWDKLSSLEGQDIVRLDVRTAEEYARGHVPGFINIPLHELRERIGELPQGKPVYVHCLSGLRSYVACRILTGSGFECCNISGGYFMYRAVFQKED